MNRRTAHLRLRVFCVAACAAALPLYAAEEAVSRVQGRPYLLPWRLLDRLDGRLTALEDRVTAGGGDTFVTRLCAATETACNAIDTALTYLTGRA